VNKSPFQPEQEGNRLHVLLSHAEPWANGQPMRLPEGVRTFLLWFYLGERPLEATGLWRIAERLIGPAIGEALQRAVRSDEALIVTPGSDAPEVRSLGRASVQLDPDDAIYIDYILANRSRNFHLHRFRVNEWADGKIWDEGESVLYFEPPHRSVVRIFRRYWGWGFHGWVLHRRDLGVLRQLRGPEDGHPSNLDRAELFFEECYDQAAVRIWTVKRTEEEIVAQLDLDEMNKTLSAVRVPHVPKGASRAAGS
jgi:hypothetical protein